MAKKYDYDCLWYWNGGTEHGRWFMAWGDGTIESLRKLREEIQRGGRVCFMGRRQIGAPDGPPKHSELVAVGFIGDNQ